MEFFFSPTPTSVHTMPDGSKVETQVVSASASTRSVLLALHNVLSLWTQHMRGHFGDVVVGFDVEWSGGDNPRVTLLKLGCSYGCLLVTLDNFQTTFVHRYLRNFLLMKDIITFVGIHIREGLKKLEKDYGIVMRNVVDLSDPRMAGKLVRPIRGVCSIRSLANEFFGIRMEHRSLEIWGTDSLSEKQIEGATIEAHFIFRIAVRALIDSRLEGH